MEVRRIKKQYSIEKRKKRSNKRLEEGMTKEANIVKQKRGRGERTKHMKEEEKARGMNKMLKMKRRKNGGSNKSNKRRLESKTEG